MSENILLFYFTSVRKHFTILFYFAVSLLIDNGYFIQVGYTALSILHSMVSAHSDLDDAGEIVTPTPRVKRILSSPRCLPHIAQVSEIVFLSISYGRKLFIFFFSSHIFLANSNSVILARFLLSRLNSCIPNHS